MNGDMCRLDFAINGGCPCNSDAETYSEYWRCVDNMAYMRCNEQIRRNCVTSDGALLQSNQYYSVIEGIEQVDYLCSLGRVDKCICESGHIMCNGACLYSSEDDFQGPGSFCWCF